MKYKNSTATLPSYYRSQINKDLVLKGEYGILELQSALMIGSIFSTSSFGGADYKIVKLIKIDGYANHIYKIKRCDTSLSQYDTTVLTKNTIIKVKYTSPLKIEPGYTI